MAKFSWASSLKHELLLQQAVVVLLVKKEPLKVVKKLPKVMKRQPLNNSAALFSQTFQKPRLSAGVFLCQ
jgi:hypothetical protein